MITLAPAVLFEAAHRTQPRLQPPVIALDPVVGVLVGAMPCRWQQVLQHGRVDRRLIGGDLDGPDPGRVDSLVEEPTGGLGVSARGDEHVDDLSELVDRAVDVTPAPSHLHIRLVHLPAVTHDVSARPSSIGQQRRESQHPPVDRHVVHLDTTLGEQFLDVAVGQAEA
jgi:hypothetical protein